VGGSRPLGGGGSILRALGGLSRWGGGQGDEKWGEGELGGHTDTERHGCRHGTGILRVATAVAECPP
jgi:hypothetical protein